MKIQVNGELLETSKTTISGLLSELKIISERVAVEVNLKVIKQVAFKTFKIKEGDIIEIVNFVGGG